MKKILIIDDDKRLRQLLSSFMEREGYDVATAKDGDEALEKLENDEYSILVLDRMMPGMTGIELIPEIRKFSEAPILMLTAMGDVDDRISGLEAGVDDYLTKPFEPKELLLRVSGILKRTRKRGKVVFGDFAFNLDNGDLHKEGEFINLSSTELKLLNIFVANIDKPITRIQLSKKLNNISERSVDVQITRLRKKIEDDPSKPVYLQTAWGAGYILRSRA